MIDLDETLAIELAAQCWTDQNTEHIIMDIRLAEAFTKRLVPLIKELKAAREVIDFADKFRKFSAHALPTCYSKSCECWHDALAQSIARYDEARR